MLSQIMWENTWILYDWKTFGFHRQSSVHEFKSQQISKESTK